MVGAYLDGELAADDLHSFEAEMQTNEQLNRLVSEQKEILEGIKAYRKQEIIARLDSLPIPPQGVTTGMLVKIISATLIIGAVGFGIYQFLPESAPNTPDIEQVETSAPDTEKIPDSEPQEETKSENTATNEIVEDVVKEETETQTAQDDNTPEIVVPTVTEPDMGLESEGEEDLEIPTSSIGVAEVSETSTMAVDIVEDGQYNFHYQVVDEKLILYGNFNDEPYQIIEINVKQERQWYLYFKESYYAIEKQNADITPLERLTNTSLIEALNKRKDQDS